MTWKIADYFVDGAEYMIEDGLPFDSYFDHEAFEADYGMGFHEFFHTAKSTWGFSADAGKGKRSRRVLTPREKARLTRCFRADKKGE